MFVNEILKKRNPKQLAERLIIILRQLSSLLKA